MFQRRFKSCLLVVAMACALSAHGEPPAEDAPSGSDALLIDQQELADKYARLEEVLLRMAELNAGADPQRAALLRKTIAESKQRMVGIQLDSIAELIEKGQLSRAVENQESVGTDLGALLELLLSENRSDRLASEKARIRQYLKELNLLIKQQKSIQGRTEGTGDPKRLANEQEQVESDTKGLAEEIQQNEEPDVEDEEPSVEVKPTEPSEEPEPAKGEDSSEEDSSDGEPSDGKSTEGESTEGEPSEGEPVEGEPEAEDQSEPGEQQGETPPTDSAEPSSDNPTRERLEEATKRMRQAVEELKRAEREKAVEEQEEAIRNLEQAKADLEEILRQLREEEIEQVLEMLQSRFVRMLKLQRAVLAATKQLDEATSDGQLTHNQEIEASRLSGQEAQIVGEADKALLLLREEGSAVAFPEAVEQMRRDMVDIVDQLAQSKVGELTQAVEEEVVAALEEMVEALQKAMEDAEERREGTPPPGGGQGGDPSLVDTLAELKMIRALQIRVNSRTERYSKLMDGEQAEAVELLEALDELAERQDRIYRITKDLQMGRNQ